MNELTFKTNINFKNAKPASKTIFTGMGYGDNSAPELIASLVDKLIIESGKYANICGGFKIFKNGSLQVQSGFFTLQNLDFFTDKIISKQLKKSTAMAFLVVTLGTKYDQWIRELFESGDSVKGYIADTIGSEMAENAADIIEQMIVEEAKKYDLGCTNRYSPGYCGWSVSEQHKFFSLLPDQFCGIKLSASALMNPIKSVSAVVGIGTDCEKRDYQCSLCSMEDCYKRKRISVS